MEFDFADYGRRTSCPHCGKDIALVPANGLLRALARIARWLAWRRFAAFLAGGAVVFACSLALHEPRWERIDPSQLDAEQKERAVQALRVIDRKPVNQYWLTDREMTQLLTAIRFEVEALEQTKPELWEKALGVRKKLVDSLAAPAGKFAFDMPHADRMLTELVFQDEVRASRAHSTPDTQY